MCQIWGDILAKSKNKSKTGKKKLSTKKSKNKVYVARGVLLSKKVSSKKKAKKKTIPAGVIADFAGIQFRVEESYDKLKALIMNEPTYGVSGEWAVHKKIGKKANTEFLGPGLGSFSLSIVVDAKLGYKPHTVMKKLNSFCREGKHDTLVIGKHKIGYEWKIDSVSNAYKKIWRNGQLTRCQIDLSISEYN